MRLFVLAALAVFSAGAALSADTARASDLSVPLDEVTAITFGKPVSTVYVGNPAIADINMIDARHGFVLGKGFGSTNVIALNHDGVQISNTRINVLSASRESTVTLNRGAARVTYSCSATRCEASPQPGDGKDAFGEAAGQLGAHQQTAEKAATAQ
jgi:Flp pilus assembly secretin CpaC